MKQQINDSRLGPEIHVFQFEFKYHRKNSVFPLQDQMIKSLGK
jgi:hypothetical protein